MTHFSPYIVYFLQKITVFANQEDFHCFWYVSQIKKKKKTQLNYSLPKRNCWFCFPKEVLSKMLQNMIIIWLRLCFFILCWLLILLMLTSQFNELFWDIHPIPIMLPYFMDLFYSEFIMLSTFSFLGDHIN